MIWSVENVGLATSNLQLSYLGLRWWLRPGHLKWQLALNSQVLVPLQKHVSKFCTKPGPNAWRSFDVARLVKMCPLWGFEGEGLHLVAI